MNKRLKNLAVTLTVVAIFFGCILANIKLASSIDSGGKIDLFTQKEPFSGKGPNMPSDAFGPGELVFLYALVTYNDVPMQNVTVSFYVRRPDNQSFTINSDVNASGIASVEFAIPQKNMSESEIFGEWFALANTLIRDRFLQDTLTFGVDWIVKLISVRTIDENLTFRTFFGKDGYVGLEITLRSIAMVMKSATLAIAIQDEQKVVVNYTEIPNLDVQPNEKLIYLYSKSYIPKWAFVGNATVFVSALTAPANQGGVAYCPSVLANFSITAYPPLAIALHDVAVVNVSPLTQSVEVGELVTISALVRNEGTETESLTVYAYLNDTLIGTQSIVGLAPYLKTTVNFTFGTSIINLGKYIVTISIPPLPKEADLTDNVFTDAVIEIKPKAPVIIHDISIVNVTISKNSLYKGETLQINVSVINKGTETESFDVKTHYAPSLIETLHVDALAPNTEIKLVSAWNTSSVHEGFYPISASAPLPGDVNAADNTFVDGIIQIKTRPPISLIHDVAILNVTSSTTLAQVGEVVDIRVKVKNEGTTGESFTVTAFYNSTVVGTLFVEGLDPGNEKQLVFHWNTQNVTEGNYILKAYASTVPGEDDTGDNYFEDGIVKISAAPKGLPLSIWLWWLLILLLILMIILLIIWFYHRAKQSESKTTLKPSAMLPKCFQSSSS